MTVEMIRSGAALSEIRETLRRRASNGTVQTHPHRVNAELQAAAEAWFRVQSHPINGATGG